MSWIMRDFECKCGEAFEDLVDNKDEEESPCPACGSLCTYLAISPVPLKTFSLMNEDDRRRTMLKRSADHTLREIHREPEKHGEVSKKIYKETTINSSRR